MYGLAALQPAVLLLKLSTCCSTVLVLCVRSVPSILLLYGWSVLLRLSASVPLVHSITASFYFGEQVAAHRSSTRANHSVSASLRFSVNLCGKDRPFNCQSLNDSYDNLQLATQSASTTAQHESTNPPCSRLAISQQLSPSTVVPDSQHIEITHCQPAARQRTLLAPATAQPSRQLSTAAMLVKSDTADEQVDRVTPTADQSEPQSSPILPSSMQQRLAAWDDEDRDKAHDHQQQQQQQQYGVWLAVEEREALEVEWRRQVEEVKEAWRLQAECKERERERQHQHEREAWQAIECSRRERETAEELIHAQRRQQLEEEDRLLQRAIDERKQQLQQVEQQIEQQRARHAQVSGAGKEGNDQSEQRVEKEADQEEKKSSVQQQSTAATDEMEAEVTEMQERLAALREEEEETRRRMREERRQLNRDNMALLIAIERNRQRLQQYEQSDDQPTTHVNSPAVQPAASLTVPLSPPSPPSNTSAVDASATTKSSHSDDLRTLRQQLTDERRRVEALQQRREAAEAESRTLQARLRQLKDDDKQRRATLAHREQRWRTQLSELQQHNQQLARTVQSLHERVEEVDEEVTVMKAEREAIRRMDRYRLLESGGGGRVGGRGKENGGRMGKVVERRMADDTDDGLDGLVDGLKGLRQAQAALHSRLNAHYAPPSKESVMPVIPMTASPPAHPLLVPVKTAGKLNQSSPAQPARRFIVPLSPALSTVSSIADSADMSCCHPNHSSPTHYHNQEAVRHTSIRAHLQSLSAARCMR